MILIALGANLPSPAGPPQETLKTALRRLTDQSITIVKQSGFYRSVAWPDPSDPSFVNAVAAVKTDLAPAALLAVLHQTEAAFGRQRSVANAPRTLDLDLLDYDGRIEDGPPRLPHPRMDARAFVLVPLRDVAPDWRHPISGLCISELIESLPPGGIERLAPS
jgi:2-amino-4-hydroxy-6-hydroxymethyldihydropteridine diphosphokinase